MKDAQALQGQTVTLGVWMWASQPAQARLPWVMAPVVLQEQVVNLTAEPQFYALQVTIPAGAWRVWVALEPSLSPGQKTNYYFDGFVLALGARPVNELPHFTAPDGSRGDWGGQPFVNLLRNPSVENAGLRIYPPLDNLGARLLPNDTRPSMLLTSLFDWSAAGYFYRMSAKLLVQRFWAVFGWAHINLLNLKVYGWLSAVTLAGLCAAVVAIARRRRGMAWEIVLVLGLMISLTWGIALVRGTSFIYHSSLYFTVARHGYPVIIPTFLALLLGWREILNWLQAALRALSRKFPFLSPLNDFGQSSLGQRLAVGVVLVLLLVLDLYSIWSITQYYATV